MERVLLLASLLDRTRILYDVFKAVIHGDPIPLQYQLLDYEHQLVTIALNARARGIHEEIFEQFEIAYRFFSPNDDQMMMKDRQECCLVEIYPQEAQRISSFNAGNDVESSIFSPKTSGKKRGRAALGVSLEDLENVDELTNVQLLRLCKLVSLPSYGGRNDLLARLHEFVQRYLQEQGDSFELEKCKAIARKCRKRPGRAVGYSRSSVKDEEESGFDVDGDELVDDQPDESEEVDDQDEENVEDFVNVEDDDKEANSIILQS
jgi:hypothetical protein